MYSLERLQQLAGIISEQETNNEEQPLIPIDPEPEQIPQPEEPETEPEPEQEPEPTVQVITKDQAKQFIKATKGKFFTVTFIKKDGTIRVMNARLGVKVYLKGGELPYDPEAKGLIPVYSMDTKAYRMVNTKTITNLKIGNTLYQVK